ncbi:hypothetical protein JCM8202_004988 [Rhodotorula sphaerocarpa]
MSYPGQTHHPHTPGHPPNPHLIPLAHYDDQRKPYVPEGLQLVQAHWFVRHGERAPVRQRLVGVGEIPAVFPLCSIGRDFRTSVLSFTAPSPPPQLADTASPPPPPSALPSETSTGARVERSTMEVRRLAEDVGPGARGTVGGLSDCYWGELTDLGRRSTLELGARLRSLYVDQLGFLPPTLDSASLPSVALRSTNMPRTIESLHQVVEGLFGKDHRDPATRVAFTVRGWLEEDLYPNTSCRRLRALDAASIAKAAEMNDPGLAELDPVLGHIVGGPLRVQSAPKANGILDTAYCCRAHGIKLPKELDDPNVLRKLEDAVVHEWFDGYANPEFRKLAMGRLLGSLRQSLYAKMRDPTEAVEKTRLAVYACHDTSVAGILNALDCFDGRWPPFTSHVCVELFRSGPPASGFLSSFKPPPPHYVRLRFNGRTIRLPACAPEGKHLPGSEGQVCTFEAFSEAARKVEVSQEEWRRMCGNAKE